MTAAAEAAAIVADVFGDKPTLGEKMHEAFAPLRRSIARMQGTIDTSELDAWLDWSRDTLAWYDAEVAEGVRKPVTVPTARLNQRVQKALRDRKDAGRFDRAAALIREQVERSCGVTS
jgi:hypothetical protein